MINVIMTSLIKVVRPFQNFIQVSFYGFSQKKRSEKTRSKKFSAVGFAPLRSFFASLLLGWCVVVQAAAPTITNIWPEKPSPGTLTTIWGTNLTPGEVNLSYGGVSIPFFQSVDNNSLFFKAPEGGTGYQACVTTLAGSDCFDHPACPESCITNILPPTANVNDLVFLYGSGFTFETRITVNGIFALAQNFGPALHLFMVPAGVTTTSTSNWTVEACNPTGECTIYPQPVCGDPVTGDINNVNSKVLVFSFNPVMTNVVRPTPSADILAACQAADPSIYKDTNAPLKLNEYLCVTGFHIGSSRSGQVLASNFLDRISKTSKGKYNNGCPRFTYEIVDVVEADAWPVYNDGFQYTNESFVAEYNTLLADPGWKRVNFHGGGNYGALDEVQFLKMANLDQRVMDGEIDEVIFHVYGDVGTESAMVGKGAFSLNGNVIGDFGNTTTSTRAYAVVPACFQCFNHRLEATMKQVFGSNENVSGTYSFTGTGDLFNPNLGETTHAWNRFTMIDKQIDVNGSQSPWLGAIGNAHFPVNARGNNDYYDGAPSLTTPWPVSSNADDWYNYPKMAGNIQRSISCSEWGCADKYFDVDTSKYPGKQGYTLWLLQHIPRADGINDGYPIDSSNIDYSNIMKPDDVGMLNNWWRYLFDVDQFKSPSSTSLSGLPGLLGSGRLVDDRTPPTVTILSPTSGQNVQGTVSVKVDVIHTNPIYRVELYVDGTYHSTDTLRPYTFNLDAASFLGTPTLVAKAYAMPDSLVVGTSVPTQVNMVASTPLTLNPIIVPQSAPPYTPIRITLSASGGSGSFSFQQATQNYLPDGATITDCLGGDCTKAELLWVPRFDQRGAQWIRFIVTDTDPNGGSQVSQDVVIPVGNSSYTLTDLQLRQQNGGNLDIRSVAIDPNDSNIVYAGTKLKGFYKGVLDIGGTWQWQPIPINDSGLIGEPEGGMALITNPSTTTTPGSIYGATGYPGALYEWLYDGLSNTWAWERKYPAVGVSLNQYSRFFSLAIDPTDPGRIFAGNNNQVPLQDLIGFLPSQQQPSGEWISVLDPDNSVNGNGFAEGLSISSIEPGINYTTKTIYAGFGYSGQNSNQTYPVYRSIQGGAPGTWVSASGTGFPDETTGSLPFGSDGSGVDMLPGAPNIAYVAVPNGLSPGGLYMTNNYGDTWARVIDKSCRVVRVSPVNSNYVVAGCDGAIFLIRRDTGNAWEYIGSAGTTYSIAFDYNDANRIVIGTSASVFEVDITPLP